MQVQQNVWLANLVDSQMRVVQSVVHVGKIAISTMGWGMETDNDGTSTMYRVASVVKRGSAGGYVATAAAFPAHNACINQLLQRQARQDVNLRWSN